MNASSLLNPFDTTAIPVGEWVSNLVQWLVTNYRFLFQDLKQPVNTLLTGIEHALRGCPPVVLIAIVFLLVWQAARLWTALFVVVALTLIGCIGAWPGATTTFAIVITSVLICCLFGLPLGILAAQSRVADRMLRPLLDFLQTIPSFVYLVPIVMLLGIGDVPGVCVTIIYAISPLIRLTNLGIRQVPHHMVEASDAFGASRLQTLVKIQLPLARPTILAGLSQTIMLSLSMSVIASMISVAGLGQMVLRGIGRMDISLSATGGLGIVLIAMIVDRVSQSLGANRRERTHQGRLHTGPVGLLRRAWARAATQDSGFGRSKSKRGRVVRTYRLASVAFCWRPTRSKSTRKQY